MRKICVFTGGRAEYGLLKPLLFELKKDKSVKLQILVAGMHLSREFGLTYQAIEDDGFICDEKVEMILSSDSVIAISKSMGLGMISFSEALSRLSPDVLVTLGDRYENMAVVTTAWVSRIPVAHIQGGEKTLGAIDDQFRHCITKMSSIHFVAAAEYEKRVIQLGEFPDKVFNVGALNVDAIKKIKFLPKVELEEELNFKFEGKTLLVTFHPVTLENNTSAKNFKHLLDAIDDISGLKIIFTKTLADTEGRVINEMIDKYVAVNKNKSVAFTSMGQIRYLSALNYIGAVAGNSSSGIIETPSFKVPTINIGIRESGRIIAKNVITVKNRKEDIKIALIRAFSLSFRKSIATMKNPYEKDDTAGSIARTLSNYQFGKTTMKEFYDL